MDAGPIYLVNPRASNSKREALTLTRQAGLSVSFSFLTLGAATKMLGRMSVSSGYTSSVKLYKDGIIGSARSVEEAWHVGELVSTAKCTRPSWASAWRQGA